MPIRLMQTPTTCRMLPLAIFAHNLPLVGVCVKRIGTVYPMAHGIGRPMAVLVLSDEERSYLERQVRRRRVARSLSDRCRMILRCADGLTNKAVAIELGVHEHTIGKWRRRFLKERIDGLSDEPRPGRPRTLTDDRVAEVIERTLETTPADATHWSIRSMARETGLSHTTIRRIWAAFSVQPHRSETFKLSGDPLFVDKVRDIVGLYLSPPDRALVLCVDDKSQIQALDRVLFRTLLDGGFPGVIRHGNLTPESWDLNGLARRSVTGAKVRATLHFRDSQGFRILIRSGHGRMFTRY